MILGAFGDSFTFGSDLKDVKHDIPSKLVWPALIANQLDLEFVNYGTPGIGNLIIADDVLRCINTHKNNVFYVINWTWIDRYDYLDTEIQQTNFGPKHVDNIWHTLRPGDVSKHSTYYYKHLHKDFTSKLQNLLTIQSVISELVLHNCLFLMTYMDHILFDKRFFCSPSIDILQNTVQKHMHSFHGKNFLDWSKEHNFLISESWHPLEQAHEKAAEYWLPRVKTLLNTHAKEDYLHAFK